MTNIEEQTETGTSVAPVSSSFLILPTECAHFEKHSVLYLLLPVGSAGKRRHDNSLSLLKDILDVLCN